MHILYFHQYFSTPSGSTGTRSYQLALKLIQRGHDVTMVCGSNEVSNTGLKGGFKKNYREGSIEGIKVIEFSIGYSNSNSFIKRFIKFIRFSLLGIKTLYSQKYDLIFCTSTPLTAGIPGVFSKLFFKKTFVFEVRDLWPELPKALGVIKNPLVIKALEALETLIYRSSDTCIGLAPGIVEGIKRKVPHKKVHMISNGCDFYFDNETKHFNDKKLIAVFCGAHGLANGLDNVLDVCKNLVERQLYNIEIQLIGTGALKPKLQLRSKNEGLINCKFLDPMPKKLLFDYLRKNADVGLMVLEDIPAFYNGTSPNKFFDYLSLGLPIINNYPGWIAENIISNKCGLVVPPNNLTKFSEALIYLKNNKEELRAMSNNSLALAKSSFDRDVLSENFSEIIEQTFLEKKVKKR